MVGAVIYVRVSTKEQTENLSLPTQLRACEEYCRRQGYEILERFHEEGESAKTTDRSQLQNLLTFCRLNKGRVHFVVVFNLTRFARDKYDHFGAFRYPSGAGNVQRPSSSAARMPARVRSERTSLSNCANAASTPSISLPVDVSSIGSVADRNEMPSDWRCERSAK